MFIGILGALLFLVSIVWLIVVAFQKKSRKIPAILLLVGFIMFIVGVSTDDVATTEAPTTSEDSSAVVSSVDEEEEIVEETEEKVELTATEKIEKLTESLYEDNLREITISKTEPYDVFVDHDLKDSFTNNMMRTSYYMDVQSYLEEVKELPINEVYIAAWTTLTDQYGSESEAIVLSTTFSKDTIAKINFDNITTDNIPAIADDFFIRQVMRD